MKIDRLMKKIMCELKLFMGMSYFVEALYAIASSVLITQSLSAILSAIIYQSAREEVMRKLLFFVGVSLGIILLSFINKLNDFIRTKKTIYRIEDEVYDYIYRIRYYDGIRKDEMQAYITRSLVEYNDLYFSTIGEAVRIGVLIVASVIYSVSITPYSIIVVTFMAGLLLMSLRGKLDKLPGIQKDIIKYNNDLYRNLWEGIENLEIERFLNLDAVLERYRANVKKLVSKRVEYNKISVRASFLSQFGSILSIILMIITGMFLYGFRADSIGNILPLVIIVPSISSGIFAIPSLMTYVKKMKGIRKSLDDYFTLNYSRHCVFNI